MSVVMIRCPSTGHAVSTGIEMSNLDQLPAVTATMACSACGSEHKWTKADAWLADGGEYYRMIITERQAGGRRVSHNERSLRANGSAQSAAR